MASEIWQKNEKERQIAKREGERERETQREGEAGKGGGK